MTERVVLAIVLLIQLRMWWLTQDTHWKIQCANSYLHRIDQRTMK